MTTTVNLNTTTAKIVSMSELSAQMKKVTTKDQSILMPYDMAQMIGQQFGASVAATPHVMANLKQSVPDKTCGIYRNSANPQDLYVSSKTLAFIFQSTNAVATSEDKAFLQARADIVNKALEQCHDHTALKSKLVPVMP